jgi:hypothetical protein
VKRKLILALVYLAALPLGLAIGYHNRDSLNDWLAPVPETLPAPAPPGSGVDLAPRTAPQENDRLPAGRDLLDPDTGLIELEGSVTATVTDENGETRTLTLENLTLRPAGDE